MIESVALRAPTSPPETGASRLATPRSRAASKISLASDGSLVLMSTITEPGSAVASTPCSAEDHLTHVGRITDHRERRHRHRRAASAGVCAQAAPLLEQRLGPLARTRVDGRGVPGRRSGGRTSSRPSRRCRPSRSSLIPPRWSSHDDGTSGAACARAGGDRRLSVRAAASTTLPIALRGSASRKRTSRGRLCGASSAATCAISSRSSRGAAGRHDPRDDALAEVRVGLARDGDLEHAWMIRAAPPRPHRRRPCTHLS